MPRPVTATLTPLRAIPPTEWDASRRHCSLLSGPEESQQQKKKDEQATAVAAKDVQMQGTCNIDKEAKVPAALTTTQSIASQPQPPDTTKPSTRRPVPPALGPSNNNSNSNNRVGDGRRSRRVSMSDSATLAATHAASSGTGARRTSVDEAAMPSSSSLNAETSEAACGGVGVRKALLCHFFPRAYGLVANAAALIAERERNGGAAGHSNDDGEGDDEDEEEDSSSSTADSSESSSDSEEDEEASEERAAHNAPTQNGLHHREQVQQHAQQQQQCAGRRRSLYICELCQLTPSCMEPTRRSKRSGRTLAEFETLQRKHAMEYRYLTRILSYMLQYTLEAHAAMLTRHSPRPRRPALHTGGDKENATRKPTNSSSAATTTTTTMTTNEQNESKLSDDAPTTTPAARGTNTSSSASSKTQTTQQPGRMTSTSFSSPPPATTAAVEAAESYTTTSNSTRAPASLSKSRQQQQEQQQQEQEEQEDEASQPTRTNSDVAQLRAPGFEHFYTVNVPRVSIYEYLRRIVQCTYISPSVLLIAFRYIDRLLEWHSGLFLVEHNVHKLLLAAVRVASKVYDTYVLTNKNFADVTGIPRAELDVLEACFVKVLNLRLYVAPEEFRNYTHDLVAAAAGVRSTTSLTLSSASAAPAQSSCTLPTISSSRCFSGQSQGISGVSNSARSMVNLSEGSSEATMTSVPPMMQRPTRPAAPPQDISFSRLDEPAHQTGLTVMSSSALADALGVSVDVRSAVLQNSNSNTGSTDNNTSTSAVNAAMPQLDGRGPALRGPQQQSLLDSHHPPSSLALTETLVNPRRNMPLNLRPLSESKAAEATVGDKAEGKPRAVPPLQPQPPPPPPPPRNI